MAAPKKRKLTSECRRFQTRWENEYFFKKIKGKCVCLIYDDDFAVMKKYNVRRHYETKHQSYASYTGAERACVNMSPLVCDPSLCLFFCIWPLPKKLWTPLVNANVLLSFHLEHMFNSGLHGSSGKLTGSTSSLNKLSVQGSNSRRSQSSSLLDMGNMSASDLDVADRTKFDKIFEQVLSELEPLCLAEQDFISKFFKLQQHPPVLPPLAQPEAEDSDGGVPSRMPPQAEHRHSLSSDKDMVRLMMNKVFQSIEPELNSLIALGDKMDSFHSLYMLVKMSHHVWTAENVDPASFLSTTLGNVLVTVKRNFDKCISVQIRQMEEVKISKKSKVGILPFVTGFEEFAELAETIFRNAERRGDLDKAYVKLIRAVFMNVEKVANESQKTPRDVVMMENFHHIFSTLSQLKISCLDAERREAKHKYTDHLQSYVINSLGQPLEKLNHFFEGVEARVAQGIREEEVSYQLAFNKQELRKVIKEYPGKEVKKGLDNLYKKVDKHLCEEESLLQVVWHSTQDEFIRQYKHFEDLIGRCYPGSGITMEFTIQDMLEYFSSIAQSH